MSLWKWNDVELEIDMEDYDFLQKYEKAFEAMDKREKELQKVGANTEIVKEYCDMIRNLFDDIFGKETSDKLFGTKRNTRICEECYDSFLSECNKCVVEANKRRANIANKYKPNRAQRRGTGKK